jgi:hypothetical protein
MSRTLAYHVHEAEPGSEEELELQAEFLQDVADFGDIYDDIGPANQLREKFRMTERLGELAEAASMCSFGEYDRILEIDGTRDKFPTAIVKIVHERDVRAEDAEGEPSPGS